MKKLILKITIITVLAVICTQISSFAQTTSDYITENGVRYERIKTFSELQTIPNVDTRIVGAKLGMDNLMNIAAVGKGKKAKQEVGKCGGGSGGCFCAIIATEENGVPSIIKEATFLGKSGLQIYYNHQVDEMLFR